MEFTLDASGAQRFAPSSYEYSHMKRPRGGSISGRLRTVSDMEDKGVIDKSLKGVIKDKIILGDKSLEAALDQFEQGNTADIEAMIQRGEIQRNDSIDFLDNLDFDFFRNDMLHSNSIADTSDVDFNAASPGVQQHQPFSQGVHPQNINEFSFEQQFEADDEAAVDQGRDSTQSSQYPSYSETRKNSLELPPNVNYGSSHSASRPRNSSIDSLLSFMGRRDSYDMDALLNPDGSAEGFGMSDSLSGGKRKAGNKSSGAARRSSGTQQGATGSGGGRFANIFDEDNETSYFEQFQMMQNSNYQPFQSVVPEGVSGRGEKLSKAQQKQHAAAALRSTIIKPSDKTYKSSVQSDAGYRSSQGGRVSMHESDGTNAAGLGIGYGSQHADHTDPSGQAAPQFSFPPQSQGSQPVETGSGNATSGEDGHYIGVYSAEARKQRIARFLEKRNRRVWTKRVKYDVRKNFADSRIRVKGRFVKKEDEDILRELKDINEEN